MELYEYSELVNLEYPDGTRLIDVVCKYVEEEIHAEGFLKYSITCGEDGYLYFINDREGDLLFGLSYVVTDFTEALTIPGWVELLVQDFLPSFISRAE